MSVLLSRLHPDAERIDGIGGDGGRDVQLRAGERLDLFELKSFTGRLSARSPDRRRQVEESLRTAAGLQPDSWSLVVPIDHNPDELRWFDELSGRFPFALSWLGRTWLDDQMSAFPDIPRYYLDDAHHQVVDLLRELNAEQSVLDGGVADAIDRFDRLRTRLNELDPQYQFEIVAGPAEAAMQTFPRAEMYSQMLGAHGPVTVAVISRYRNATRDRPIRISGNFVFSDSEVDQEAASRFRDFLDFGDPTVIAAENVQEMTVEAPGGLGGVLPPGTVRVGPVAEDTQFLLESRLGALDEAGSQLASLPIRFTRRQGGRRGVTIMGEDSTGVLQVSIRLDETEQMVTVNFAVRQVEGLLPATLLPVLRLAYALRSPHKTSLIVGGRDLWREPRQLPDVDLVSSEYLEFVEQLARVQTETNTPFSLPEEIAMEDVSALRRLVRLLDGESIAVQSEPIECMVTADELQRLLADNDQGFLGVEAVCTQVLMGEEIHLGLCNVVTQPVRIERVESGPVASDGRIQIRLVPDAGARALLRRGTLIPS
ncbi:hypothetical protein ACGFIF_43585 [Kribbella sp. NPDC049174]|uniref:hypothetical protein n=1 Tax=Kribbella sp. NPDC049174 TaxID=3364112 RepID=UPI00372458E5